MPVLEPRVRSHARFESTVTFELRLASRTGLHIGAGKSVALVGSDLPVLRDAAGRPLVPGSSLRGVLRSGVEAVCATLDLDDRIPDAGAENSLPDELVDQWNQMGVIERLFGRIAERSGDFSFASRLQISDCRCTEDVVEVELRDGVAIGRELRTAATATGGKFDVEVVPAGTSFRGSVRLVNPEDFEVGLVAQALWMLDQGLLLLGGKSARGLGWMEVQVSTPRVVSADDLLSRGPAGGSAEESWAGVDEHLGEYLDALRELADQQPVEKG